MLLAVLALCLLTVRPARAQDSNYWTNKYGTRSILLNGAVIGGPVDLSAMYYNPGGLSLLKDPGTVLTVKAFAFSNISLPDAGGRSIDLNDPRSTVLPTFVGGLLNVRILGSDALAYSLFPRQGLKANITGRSVGQSDILPSPGLEQTYVEARIEQDLDETWAGLTWSKKLSEHVGIGFSPYVAVRNQRTRAQIIAQAMGSDSTGAVTTIVRGFQYSNYGLLAKAGVSFQLKKVDLGLTLTTPRVKIMGSGEGGIDRFRLGQDVDGDGSPDNVYGVSLQQDLPSKFKSPVSVGAGATVPLGSSTLYLSGEWFDKVAPFNVLEVAPVTDQVSGQPVPFGVVQQAKSVTNGGIGLEHHFNAKFTGYASFSTDYSTAVEGQSDTAVSNWDIYLVTAGTTFAVKKTEFTVGAGYAFGDSEARIPSSLTEGTVGNDIGAPPTLGTLHYSSFQLIFGFSI
jgi:hypothetical protein